MKRNFDLTLTRLDGKPFMESDAADAKPMTLKTLSFLAVGMQIRGDENLSGTQKIDLFNMVAKTAKGGVVELTTEDLALLKDRIGKCFPPLVVGEAYRLLEQDYVEPAAEAEAQLP